MKQQLQLSELKTLFVGFAKQAYAKRANIAHFCGLAVLFFMIIYKNSPISGLSFITSERVALLLIVGLSLYKNSWKIKADFQGEIGFLWGKMTLFQLVVLLYSGLLLIIFGFSSGVTLAEEIFHLLLTFCIAYLFLPGLIRSVDEFMNILLAVTLFQCAIILLGLVSPSFADLIDNSFFNANADYWTSAEFREKGYPVGLACVAAKGVMQLSLGVGSCVYFLLKHKRTWFYLGCFAVISVTMTAVARTGLVVAAIALVFILWDFRKHNQARFKQLVQIMLIFCAIFVFLLFIVGSQSISRLFASIFPRVADLFERGVYGSFLKFYFDGGDTVIPPISWETIIGLGLVSGTSGHGITVNADGGFFRMYAAIGLPLSIVFYIIIFAIIIRALSKIKNATVKTVAWFFVAMMLVGEFKEFYLYTRYLLTLYFVFLRVAEVQQKANRPAAKRLPAKKFILKILQNRFI